MFSSRCVSRRAIDGVFLLTCLSAEADLHVCTSSRVQARLPPTINPNPETSLSWIPPPPGWIYGHWFITHSSQPTYVPLLNFQNDLYPVFPQTAGAFIQNHDLSSYQLSGSSVIHTAYGIDTPRRSTQKSLGPEWDHVYDFMGAGALSAVNNTWELLAWGYDTCGHRYLVIYETPVAASGAPACLDLQVETDTTPSPETLQEIFHALRKLENEDLSRLVDQTIPLVQNGARNGMGPVECGVDCINNT